MRLLLPSRAAFGFTHRPLPCRPARARLHCLCGMYVPSDSFGGVSPERKAANNLRTLFTFIAVRIILAQLEGSGRGALGSYNAEQYQLLRDLLEAVPFKDGDEWLEHLLKQDRMLALRIMDVRDAYAREDFEWDQLQRLAVQGTKEANVRLMRSSATASLKASLTADGAAAAAAAAADVPTDAQQQQGPQPEQQHEQEGGDQ